MPTLASNLLLVFDATLFVLGVAAFITGAVILAWRVAGKELQTLATQTTTLAQKGLAEDVAGLVGNASALLDALRQLTATAAGAGVTLMLCGLALMGGSTYLAILIVQGRL